jgi:dTDP-4-amino-4,6-dideoxygalactose transaminase
MTKRFTLGSSSISDLEKQYVAKVLDDNYISPGPVVKHVEEETARLHGKKHGLALNSGQSAIHLAIQTLVEMKLSDKDTKPLVAVPACTYISTLAAVVLAGCDFVLIDVDLDSGNMSPKQLAKELKYYKDSGGAIDIVLPVHLYGKACDPRIFTICEEYGVWVVEDACEATFAPNMGRGHILTTSFFSNHLISAGGGGVIMTDHDDLDEYCWKLINHGRSSRFGNEDIHKIANKFHFDKWGHSMKWSDLPAAVAKAQIERRDYLYKARRDNAECLTGILSPLKTFNALTLPNHDGHTFMMYPIVLSERLDAARVIEKLNDAGIEVRRMMPITNQPVVENYFGCDLTSSFPVADLINRQGFYVGVHPELSIEDMTEMGSLIHDIVMNEIKGVYE